MSASQETLRLRSEIILWIRLWFKDKGFLELETPTLLPAPDQEPTLFFLTAKLTDPRTNKQKTAYLTTSPEYNHKKLLSKGVFNTFEITRSYRDGESWGKLHNPEFTILEWYRTPADYFDIMRDAEEMIAHLQTALCKTRSVKAAPWPHLTIIELFKKYCNADVTNFEEVNWRELAKKYDAPKDDSLSDIFYRIFLNQIEPKLANFETPVFVLDYPAFQASLAKRKSDNPNFVERFELYAGGLELANAFSELLDASEQRSRLEEQQKYRQKHGLPVPPIDENFLKSLETPIAPTSGIALGVDRLIMWLLGKEKIEDVLAIPMAELFDIDD